MIEPIFPLDDARLELRYMHNRPVVLMEIARQGRCIDCGEPPRYAVYEFPATLESSYVDMPSRWLWCGVCDIGG